MTAHTDGCFSRVRIARAAVSSLAQTDYDLRMAVDWTAEERPKIDAAIHSHPLDSGRCAALARAVFAVGIQRDPETRGRQVRPKDSAARFVVPKVPLKRRWGTHTFTEAHGHAVDALTKSDGCAADEYLRTYWQYPEFLLLHGVDLESVDPGIEDVP